MEKVERLRRPRVGGDGGEEKEEHRKVERARKKAGLAKAGVLESALT